MTLAEKALDKMLIEMAEIHDVTIERIHNWLCTQDDQELLRGILNDKKSIQKSVDFCSDKARELANRGVAMVPDDQVYSWIKYYFIEYKEPVDKSNQKPNPAHKEKVVKLPKKQMIVTKTKKENEQLSLLDML